VADTAVSDIPRHDCDLLVIGSGAAGLAAAITARLLGLEVLVVEKEMRFGGSTARSGGMAWVPCNLLAVAAGVDDTLDAALRYIEAEAGPLFHRARAEAYLTNGPAMAKTFHENTSAVRFVRTDAVSDNHQHLPGARASGRTITVPPFDGRLLKGRLRDLASPLPDLTFLGMQIQPGRELTHFFNCFNSFASFSFVVKRIGAHVLDILRYGCTTRLANGNALAARLARSAFDLGAPLWLNTRAAALTVQAGRVCGATVDRGQERVMIAARLGVVLAAGGFPHDTERRSRASPMGSLGAGVYSLAPPGNVGDGLRLAEAVGGCTEDRMPNTVSWTPVSKVTGRGRPDTLFPHGFDRNKPGFVAVTRHGARFVNEAAVGNDFIRAMVQACLTDPVEGFLITDHATLRRYGMGIVRPAPAPLRGHLRSGYLLRGRTYAELAQQCGIDAHRLQQTLARFNRDAAAGVDTEFARGTTEPERRNGDPKCRPNPCLATVASAPFYAVKLLPGDFSTLGGLRTDEHARVLDAEDQPILGLYAAGNDSVSMFGGNSAAGGATLGPALTFGYIAALHAARLDVSR
jgi:succinate dehydrogenase/fumarate reductase flavoprotein subunit